MSDYFSHDSTEQLVGLLYGDQISNGWYHGLAKVYANPERYRYTGQETMCKSFIFYIESELDYRRNGELLPSGD